MTNPTNPYRPEDHAQIEQVGGLTRVSFGSHQVEQDTATARALEAAGDAQPVSKPQMVHQTYFDVARPDDPILATARTPDGAPSTRFEDRDTVVVEGISMQIRSAIQYGYLRR
ncbi:MAG: hypothetical protein ACK52I_33595, partial [Pseudomonadota bacterium]